MVMEPYSKLLVLIRTHEYHTAGCLMWMYMVSACWILSALSRTWVDVPVSRNRWVSLVLIVGMI